MTHLAAKTQRARILDRLIAARGGWVPLPEVMQFAAQYNARVHELRKMGFMIENKTEKVDGERHSWFRLVPQPWSHPAQDERIPLVAIEPLHCDEG